MKMWQYGSYNRGLFLPYIHMYVYLWL